MRPSVRVSKRALVWLRVHGPRPLVSPPSRSIVPRLAARLPVRPSVRPRLGMIARSFVMCRSDRSARAPLYRLSVHLSDPPERPSMYPLIRSTARLWERCVAHAYRAYLFSRATIAASDGIYRDG